MEYHHQLNAPHNQMNPYSQYGGSQCNGLNLPDASSSSEKALIWSATGYMSESGYSTQAPSISSIDQFLNNDQMDNTMHNMDNASNASTVTINQQMIPIPIQPQPVQQQTQYAQLQPIPPQQQQQHEPINQTNQAEPTTDNAVENWMKCQDNSEMALKAMPELLQLLVDEDKLVVQQATILINIASRNQAGLNALIQMPNAVQCLVHCLNTTADIETARNIISALYNVSTDKDKGVKSIIESKALNLLIKMLNAPCEQIISYVITTLHNVLLNCSDKIRMQIRQMEAVANIVHLLGCHQKVKFLNITIHCLFTLAQGNDETKKKILEAGGTQMLVNILINNYNCSYQKLTFNVIRLIKVLSTCNANKKVLMQMNTVQALSYYLTNQAVSSADQQTSDDILQNALITIRNLSDEAARLSGLDQLIQNLIQLAANTKNYAIRLLTVGILSNLTYNENNKKVAVRSGVVKVLLKIIQDNLETKKTQLLEPCLCTLRHVTKSHPDMLLAQEQMRTLNGIAIVGPILKTQPDSWQCVKALLGLVRNLCSNQLNANHLRQANIIEKVTQVLYGAYTEVQLRTNNGLNLTPNLVVKVDDVNLLDIIDLSSSALVILAKDFHNQNLMLSLDCISFFFQLFFSPIINNQKAGVSILAELANNRSCVEVMLQYHGLQDYVQANFCNQFGQLKTIAELSGVTSNSNASIILQHVTTLMQRLEEHKNLRNQQFMMQQQQDSQRNIQQQFPINDQYVQQQQQQAYYNGYPQQHPAMGGFPNQPFY